VSLVWLETASRLASREERHAVEETNVRFDRESWRKLYIAESLDQFAMPLFTRGLRDYLLRHAKEDGTILSSTEDAAGDLAGVLNAKQTERKMVEESVSRLLKCGYLSLAGGRLWITRFEEAQSARSPGAKRQAKHVAAKRARDTDVTGDAPGDTQAAKADVIIASLLTSQTDETRRDETTTPKPPAVVFVACPADLKLTPDQRGTLETSLIPGWAIDQITFSFIANYQADPEDKRELSIWRKCLSKAIAGTWNDSSRRPKKSESTISSVYMVDAEGKLVS
jgi:hypothetical protein